MQPQLPSSRPDQPSQQPEQRRLPGTGRTKHGNLLPFIHLQVDISKGNHLHGSRPIDVNQTIRTDRFHNGLPKERNGTTTENIETSRNRGEKPLTLGLEML